MRVLAICAALVVAAPVQTEETSMIEDGIEICTLLFSKMGGTILELQKKGYTMKQQVDGIKHADALPALKIGWIALIADIYTDPVNAEMMLAKKLSDCINSFAE